MNKTPNFKISFVTPFLFSSISFADTSSQKSKNYLGTMQRVVDNAAMYPTRCLPPATPKSSTNIMKIPPVLGTTSPKGTHHKRESVLQNASLLKETNYPSAAIIELEDSLQSNYSLKDRAEVEYR